MEILAEINKATDWRSVIGEVLTALGTDLEAQRGYLLLTASDPKDGVIYLNAHATWTPQTFTSSKPFAPLENISLRQIGLAETHQQLKQKLMVKLTKADLALAIAGQFTIPSVQHIVLIPIAVEGQWWGVMGFEKHDDANPWSALHLDNVEKIVRAFEILVQKNVLTDFETRRQAYQTYFDDLLKDDSLEPSTVIDKVLAYGTQQLNLQIAIVSHIQGQTYTIEHFYPEDSGLYIGQIFELGKTYCSITINWGTTIAISHMGISEYNRHPCYAAFHLESYIGTPLMLGGGRYGTVNFSSPNPFPRVFNDFDKTFVKAMGNLIEQMLVRIGN